jgi:predicted amidohydrolase
MSRLVVGIVQASYKNDPLDNAEKTYKIVKRGYREADLVVLPEYSMLNPLESRTPSIVYELSEHIVGSKYLSTMVKLAAELGAAILVHFIEKTDTPPKTRSTSILITSRGEVIPVYSKMHLFDAYGYRESDFFEPGKDPGKLVLINNFQVAFAICYDIRFPELFRTYAQMGAHVVVVQAGWVRGPLKEEVLDKLASARAHENGVYVVLANQVGEMFTGRSGVYSPWGYKELDLGFDEKYVEHPLSLEEVNRAREVVPVLKQATARWQILLRG